MFYTSVALIITFRENVLVSLSNLHFTGLQSYTYDIADAYYNFCNAFS